ncbi:hypothetical protein ACJJTC_015071 [Scirpophaga incertulas]
MVESASTVPFTLAVSVCLFWDSQVSKHQLLGPFWSRPRSTCVESQTTPVAHLILRSLEHVATDAAPVANTKDVASVGNLRSICSIAHSHSSRRPLTRVDLISRGTRGAHSASCRGRGSCSGEKYLQAHD